MNLSILFLIGLVFSSLLMMLVWMIAMRIENVGIGDAAWVFGFIPLALFYRAYSDGEPARQNLITLMVMLWSMRLGFHLLKRIVIHHPREDGRYQELRKTISGHENFFFFWFFQGQALLLAFLSLPILLSNSDPRLSLGFSDVLGFLLWLVAICGETLADHQLAKFKANPSHHGKVCMVGLWRFSRHPNYFFEWLVWVAFFLFALPSSWGWSMVLAPLFMLFFLLRVTGPHTEEQALRSYGTAYREYQCTTNAFIPWLPKGNAA